MNRKPTITAIAFERKEELGGGYRGRLKDYRNGYIYESDVVDTVNAARHWARTKIFELMGEESWAPGYSYKTHWTLNVWQ